MIHVIKHSFRNMILIIRGRTVWKKDITGKLSVILSFIVSKMKYKFSSEEVVYPFYALMCSSFWFDTVNLGWPIVYIKGSQVIIFK